MTTTSESQDTGRHALRRVALEALYEWQVATFADVRALATGAGGASGEDILVVMRATANDLDLDFDPEAEVDEEIREELLSVDVACATGVVALTRHTVGELWPDIVTLWDSVREVVAYTATMAVPVGVVVDLDRSVVAIYDAHFCPEFAGPGGPEADTVIDCSTPPFGTADPFEEFLSSLKATEDPEDRVNILLDRYNLTPPSTEAHPAGECPDEQAFDD